MSAPLPIGRVIDDRFELLSRLGEGGHGVVYLARQVTTGQTVAVKLLLSDVAELDESSEHAARFEREMHLISRLKHPNVVQLIDSGLLPDGQLYMVLEYVEGEELFSVLRREGTLSRKEARHLMMQVLDALGSAHDQGIVHRDLKPPNIMVTTTGVRRNAMVLDFGIGAVVEAARDEAYQPITDADVGKISGTPAYMAPEQFRSQVTPQSDIYAWGLTYIECLTGERVVSGTSKLDIMSQQILPDPIAIPPSIPDPELRRILTRAVAKPLDERYGSVAEVVRDLEAYTPTEDLPALPEPSSPPPWLAIATGASVLVLLLVVVWMWPSSSESPAPEPPVVESEATDADTVAPPPSPPVEVAVVPDVVEALEEADTSRPCEGSAELCALEATCVDGDRDACLALMKQLKGSGDEGVERTIAVLSESCFADNVELCGWLIGLIQAERIEVDDARLLLLFEKSCALGEVRSCYNLGLALTQGRLGLEPNLERAAALFDKACDGGMTDACFRQGQLILGQDRAAALERFEEACDQGEPRGCARVGEALLETEGGDTERGLRLLHQACEAEVGRACARLARTHQVGEAGVLKNPGRAFSMYEHACEKLHEGRACFRLAEMVNTGVVVPTDPGRVTELYARSCDHGEGLGCFHAGLRTQYGRGVEADPKRAFHLYVRGCDTLKVDAACHKLGEWYSRGEHAAKDFAKAHGYYLRSCEGGKVAESCVHLAALFDSGMLKPRESALELFQQGCELGNVQGCSWAGDRLSGEESQPWYRKGCDLEDARSCAQLGASLLSTGKDAESLTLFQKSCDLGHALGCVYLAHQVRFIEKDLGRAASLMIQACASGAAEGCRGAGEIQVERGEPGASLAWYEKGCEAKDGESCFGLARAYGSGEGAEVDMKRAQAYLEQGCEFGHDVSCHRLARRMLRSPDAADVARAPSLYALACGRGYGMSCHEAGNLYRLGAPPIEVDREEALRWYEQGCALEHRASCRYLETLKGSAPPSDPD